MWRCFREEYNLEPNEILIIFKREYFLEGLLTPIVEYEIFSKNNKKELNMKFCQDIKINMNIPVSINEDD